MVKAALSDFTQRFVDEWRLKTGHEPVSSALYGIPSPCAVKEMDKKVFWLPAAFSINDGLMKIENALDITIHPDVHEFYCSQYAGDMTADFEGINISLIQVWNEDDFIRLQENLLGHLFTQRRLKLSPTSFIASLDSELEIISVCNISGKIIREYFGSNKREVLAPSLAKFLSELRPVMDCEN